MKRNSLKRYILPAFVLVVFEIVAITLWLTKNNIFYLFNFSYIGISITLGLVLFAQNYKTRKACCTASCRSLYAHLFGAYL